METLVYGDSHAVVVWNIQDPYFLPPKHAEKIYEQIKAKITELAKLL